MTCLIILTWNGIKYLPKLLESLNNLNYPSEKYKTVVVDSGSTDGTLEYLKAQPQNNSSVKIIELKTNFGFAAGNNIGIRYALDNGAEYIVLLNQDTLVEPNFLAELVQAAKSNEGVGIVQPLILYYPQKDEINSWGNELHFLGYGWCGGNHEKITNYEKATSLPPPLTKGGLGGVKSGGEITYASAAAVLYKAELLRKIGFFDENYFAYHEDSDICLRARLAGYKIVLAPQAIVYHDYHFPTTKNRNRYFLMEKNRLYLILKFYQLKTLLLLLPMILVMDLGQFIFSFKHGYIGQFIKSRFWFISNFRKLWQARCEVQKTRLIGDSELLKNFASKIEYQEVNNFLLEKVGNPIMRVCWNIIKKLI